MTKYRDGQQLYVYTGRVLNVSLPRMLTLSEKTVEYYDIAIQDAKIKSVVHRFVVFDDDPAQWLKHGQKITVAANLERVDGFWCFVTKKEDVTWKS